MSLTVIFWNISKENMNYPAIREAVRDLIAAHQVDLFFIADFYVNKLLGIEGDRKLFSLPEGYQFFNIDTELQRHKRIITIYKSKHNLKRFNDKLNRTYNDIIVGVNELYLFPLHLTSVVNRTELEQITENQLAIDQIHDLYDKKLIILGDFNLNPWRLNALFNFTKKNNRYPYNITADRTLAKSKQETRFLYNPTWSLFGDFYGNHPKTNSRPAASYFLKQGDKNNDHLNWNMLDQLVITPNLIDFLEEVRFIPYIDNHLFWLPNTGMINSPQYSDHLPMKFKFSL